MVIVIHDQLEVACWLEEPYTALVAAPEAVCTSSLGAEPRQQNLSLMAEPNLEAVPLDTLEVVAEAQILDHGCWAHELKT